MPGYFDLKFKMNLTRQIHQSLFDNKPETLKLLLQQGGDVNGIDGHSTPIQYAAFLNRPECITILIDHNCNLHERNYYDLDALSYAVANGNADSVRVLLDAGAKVDGVYPDDLLPENRYDLLQVAVMGTVNQSLDYNSKDKDYVSVVRQLLDASVDPNLKDKYGDTALHKVAISRHIEIALLLIEYGADIDITNNDGRKFYDGQDDFLDKIKFELSKKVQHHLEFFIKNDHEINDHLLF